MEAAFHEQTRRVNYPLSAIVGQEKMQPALLLNVINQQIGGVLIRGERDSAKTIAVRTVKGSGHFLTFISFHKSKADLTPFPFNFPFSI